MQNVAILQQVNDMHLLHDHTQFQGMSSFSLFAELQYHKCGAVHHRVINAARSALISVSCVCIFTSSCSLESYFRRNL